MTDHDPRIQTQRELEMSPCGHYIRTPVEHLSPEVKTASDAVFEDVPDLVERLNRIRKLIATVAAVTRDQWQPIASAPKGEVVLVHDEGWVGKALLQDDGRWLDVECDRPDAHIDPPPQQWQPLPAPPSAAVTRESVEGADRKESYGEKEAHTQTKERRASSDEAGSVVLALPEVDSGRGMVGGGAVSPSQRGSVEGREGRIEPEHATALQIALLEQQARADKWELTCQAKDAQLTALQAEVERLEADRERQPRIAWNKRIGSERSAITLLLVVT